MDGSGGVEHGCGAGRFHPVHVVVGVEVQRALGVELQGVAVEVGVVQGPVGAAAFDDACGLIAQGAVGAEGDVAEGRGLVDEDGGAGGGIDAIDVVGGARHQAPGGGIQFRGSVYHRQRRQGDGLPAGSRR